MQEKSSAYFKEQWESPMDTLVKYIWKHSDTICGIGIGVLIGTLFSLAMFCKVISQ